jgi:translation initiation factor 2 subunit 3
MAEARKEYQQPTMVIGTLGHVAHGKSTTVKGLSGTKPTRHSREKIRGITIELGYSACRLYESEDGAHVAARGGDAPNEWTGTDGTRFLCKRYISFADCPGHDELMTVMLGGATVMDAAILTVAADDPCPMPQTHEHLMAAEMMGLSSIIIAQNKVDLVTEEQAWEHHAALREFVQGTIGEGAPIVPLSAALGINLHRLIRLLLDLPHPPISLKASRPLRASIVRSFDINKAGKPMAALCGGVVGGTIVEGQVRLGDKVDILPGKKVGSGWEPLRCQILSMRSEKTPLTLGLPGGLIAFGTTLDPALTGSNGLIGHWLVAAGRERTRVVQEGRFRFRKMKRSVEGKKCRLHKKDRLQVNVGARTLYADFTRSKADKSVFRLALSEPIVLFPDTKLVASREGRIIGIGQAI